METETVNNTHGILKLVQQKFLFCFSNVWNWRRYYTQTVRVKRNLSYIVPDVPLLQKRLEQRKKQSEFEENPHLYSKHHFYLFILITQKPNTILQLGFNNNGKR